MQIVINIPEDDYNFIKEIDNTNSAITERLYNAVFNGTPLPKETMKDCISKSEILDIIENWDNSFSGNIVQTIRDLPTLDEILEVDKAESEEI